MTKYCRPEHNTSSRLETASGSDSASLRTFSISTITTSGMMSTMMMHGMSMQTIMMGMGMGTTITG